MRTVIASLESISPYSQSKYYKTPHLEKEQPADYEARTWRDRVHVDESTGEIFIPPMAIKNCLSESAKFLSMKIVGKGNATYTKHFEAGIIVTEGIPLGIKKTEVQGEWLFVPPDGKRGGSNRVEKCFPLIPKWKGDVQIHLLDDTITPKVFEHHLSQAGSFIGLGRFRPRKNGFYGRFKVCKLIWQEDQKLAIY